MFNENDFGTINDSGLLPCTQDQVRQQQIESFIQWKSELLSTASIYLYSSENLNVIKHLEENISNFLSENKEILLALYKLEFFHYLSIDTNQEIVVNFYNVHILEILKDYNIFEKFNETQNCLYNIMTNSEIVKSRHFQTKWEEACKIIMIAIEKAVIKRFCTGGDFIDPKHTCWNTNNDYGSECQCCADDMYFVMNYEKVKTIEQELWITHINSKNQGMLFYDGAGATSSDLLMFPEDYNIDINNMMCDNNDNIMMNFEEAMNAHSYAYFLKEKESDMNMINNLNINVGTSSYNYKDNNNCNIQNNTNALGSSSNVGNNYNHNTIDISFCNTNTQAKSTRLKFAVNKNDTNTGNNITTNNPSSMYIGKKETKTKVKNPYFKDFNFKFTKRENIDKKILRKSRKFLKDRAKKGKVNWGVLNLTENQQAFWTNYLLQNLLPPMKYHDKELNEDFEFKSFNTNYMVWLFSHKGSIELYDIYLQEHLCGLLDSFIKKFDLKEVDEINQLAYYIQYVGHIFNNCYNESHVDYDDKFTIYEEEIVSTYTQHNDSDKLSPKSSVNYDDCNNCGIFGDMHFEDIIKQNPLSAIKDNIDISFEKSEDLGKMFNNSFGVDSNECMFQDE